jgi:hypothetical protein
MACSEDLMLTFFFVFLAKDKKRREVMRERTCGLHG